MDDDRKFVLAVHEAGHAVMAVLLKRNLYYLKIDKVEEEYISGYCFMGSIDYGRTKKERLFRIERECLITIAGLIAQKSICNIKEDDVDGSYSDIESIINMTEKLFGNKEDSLKFFSLVLDKAQKIIDEHTEQIKVVANELMKEYILSGVKVRKIMQQFEQKAV